jgi:mono/diheme cytochrome c family protein
MTTLRHMKRSLPFIASLGVLAVFSTSRNGQAQDANAAAAPQLATVKQYCQGCHNDKAKTGGASFEGRPPAPNSPMAKQSIPWSVGSKARSTNCPTPAAFPISSSSTV